jgi:ADP-ribosyl-[dinitrogen reductase] hydrolase
MNYAQALEFVTAAVREAGDLLRRELHRPGGPRGTAAKAPADTEAEAIIRARLMAAFPAFSYRGEETGYQDGTDPERHCWLVDPNDGTASFHRGCRGSAVSVALLRDTRLVLGVVYSFAAPDDNGDLFTWAEGCGAIRRNGEPTAPVQEPFGRYSIVLLSEGAARRPEKNAVTCVPARFRALASIAYRLALAAAGEADAAVSLHSPGAWDYGGGHALLLAGGGRLIDQDGQPVSYSAAGESGTRWCFGGASEVACELAAREWGGVLNAPRPPADAYPPAALERGRNINDAGLLSRAQGCLLGQLAGDALGSLVEFRPPGTLASFLGGTGLQAQAESLFHLQDGRTWNTIAGQPTDDSELALMLARSIVLAGRYDPEAAARAYLYWYRSGPFDCGNTIGQAMAGVSRADVEAGCVAAALGKAASPASQANGSLMRLSPLGIWAQSQPAGRVAAHARADAELTHPHPVCREAAAVYAVALARAIGAGQGARETYDYALAWAEANVREPMVLDALLAASQQPPADYTRQAGWVLVAFQNAFYQLLHAASLAQGLITTVMAGGDTDTNGAIAGALLGAAHGRQAVPLQWRNMVLSCRPIAGLAGVHRPRPQPFWPVDALELAERLLLAAQTK